MRHALGLLLLAVATASAQASPSVPPPPTQPVTVTNTAFGSLNWTATVAGSDWLSVTDSTGGDGGAFIVHVDHTSLVGGVFYGSVEVADPNASNSPQTLPVTLRVQDQDADIDVANGYDDAWEGGPDGWVSYGRSLYESDDPNEQTQGFIVRLGDSITYANPGGQWARYGSGKTAEDVAICNWMHATDSWPDPMTNNSPNGWYLSAVDVPGRNGSYTARSSITTAGVLSGWGGLPSADEMFTEGFTNPDGKQYRDAEIVVMLLGTNDVSGPRPTADFIADLEAIADRILTGNAIVVFTTLPPRRNRDAAVQDYNAAVRALAQAKKLPLLDFYQEVLRRRPGNTWDGTLISSDGRAPERLAGRLRPHQRPVRRQRRSTEQLGIPALVLARRAESFGDQGKVLR